MLAKLDGHFKPHENAMKGSQFQKKHQWTWYHVIAVYLDNLKGQLGVPLPNVGVP